MGAMTYWDINGVAEKCNELCNEINKSWISVVTSATCEYFRAKVKGADDMEMEAIERKAKEAMDKCGDEIADKVSRLVAESSVDAYNHGFSEGSHDAEQEFYRCYHHLVNEGQLDYDPKMEKFMEILKTVSNEKFADSHRGESLMVNTEDLFGGLNKK